MPSTFSSFTAGTIANTDASDFVVGYESTQVNTLGGERRWTISTLANAVSGVMNTALNDLVTQQTITLSAPTGIVAYFASTTAPNGWAECNGAAITVAMGSTYTAIRNFLIAGGNPFGVSGSDPLLPDLRGRFIRSYGTQSTSVSSAGFGVNQTDDFKSHNHGGTVTGTASVSFNDGSSTAGGDAIPTDRNIASARSLNGTASVTIPFDGGTETRPVNLALLACIKL